MPLALYRTVEVRVGRDRIYAPRQVAEAIMERFDIPEHLFCGKTRHKAVVQARQLAVLISRECLVCSFPEIAEAMGRPNHSSVITQFETARKRMRDEPAFRNLHNQIIRDWSAPE